MATQIGDLVILHGQWELHATEPDGKPVVMSGKNVEAARRQQNSGCRFGIDHPFGAGEC